ncbi:MAG: type IV pilus twitching motility protein PilT [Bacteriovoracaceae bacterium]|nr:type IV pilus twitching motility protein PilT [Bacteriovoracaceae bacterium]
MSSHQSSGNGNGNGSGNETKPSVIAGATPNGDQPQKTASESTASINTDINLIKMQHLLQAMVSQGASDLHLVVNSAPAIRVSGDVVRLNLPALTAEASQRIIMQVLTENQKSELLKHKQVDFSFGVKNLARFRASVFYAQGNLSAVFRQIPSVIPEFEKLGLPKVLMEMCKVNNGLILVTGPTGSGKSTTLASMIDKLNRTEHCHIITLEDPIEFVHQHRNSIVNQREIGSDADSFSLGLRSMLRQDPDIVLVGELRDIETIEAALTIAETGHIVFGTLHTNSTVQTINRIINVFPADKQDQVRSLLSFVLQGVIAQQLVPKVGGGRQLIQEILRPTMGIRNLIRENKIHQVYSQMQIGQEESGMFTMNQSLKISLDKGVISRDNAINYSNNAEEMLKMLANGK